MMKKIFSTLLLPREISQFERSYLARINRIALMFFLLHVPAFALVAWANDTRPLVAILLTSLVALGPTIAFFTLRNPRAVSIVHGVSAMFMGGLLVHFGQGPAQIEMHFYFFALLAMCSVFGNPMVIIAATITVALHHLVVWLALPSSVFNYDAQWWVVGVHALFVVLEAFATCFIARSFFDNVIGLERIVQARTSELDARNQDMRMLLDNVEQGFLTIARSAHLAAERSAAIDRWFGVPAPGASWLDYLATIDPAFERMTRVSWMQLVDDILPLEVSLDQMPRHLSIGAARYEIGYRPIGAAVPPEHFLVVVSDVTERLASERAEQQRREAMAMFERMLADRGGLVAFAEEADSIVAVFAAGTAPDLTTIKRMLHTLKGNAALFGLHTIAEQCHALEDKLAEVDQPPPIAFFADLIARWRVLHEEMRRLLGQRKATIEIDDLQYASLQAAARAGDATAMLQHLQRLELEPTARRLRLFAEQTQRIAKRLGKDVAIEVEANDVRLSAKRWAPFWSAFIHGVRNAIDHGLETREERAGKPESGKLALRTEYRGDRLVVEIEDDGRGIDWEAVRARAARSGVACETQEELNAALFVDGMSTAATVTEISGRGVGMGALLAGTRALGGELSVTSKPTCGTLLRMSFPADSAFEERPATELERLRRGA